MSDSSGRERLASFPVTRPLGNTMEEKPQRKAVGTLIKMSTVSFAASACPPPPPTSVLCEK